jgi:hypothetical protein
MPDKAHARAPLWVFALVGLALAGVLAVAVVSFLGFNNEAKLRAAPWISGNPDLTDGVIVSARALKVDTAVNEITFRVSYEPKGSYADQEGRLAQPVDVEVVTDTGTVAKKFATGQEMRSQDVNEPLFDGFQADYPFDHYSTGLNILVQNRDQAAVPTSLEVVASVHGFGFSLQKDSQDADGSRLVDLGVNRSSATRLFAIFVIVMMWALTAVAIGLMVRVILLGRQLEFPMFTFLAAMLFAFPAVRNVLPGAPPLGVRSDYLSFFWCETLVAFSLIAMLGTWVVRHEATDP